MIVTMLRVRLAGPSSRLEDVLAFVQDLGIVHLVRPPVPAASPGGKTTRLARHLRHALDDVEAAMTLLTVSRGIRPAVPAEVPGIVTTARRARQLRRHAARLARARDALRDEQVMLLRYQDFFAAFESLVGHELAWPDGQAFYVVMKAGQTAAVGELRRSLKAAVGAELELIDRPLPSGEIAVLILVSHAGAAAVGKLLADSRVQELPAPPGLKQSNLLRAMPALRTRLAELPAAIHQAEEELGAAEAELGPELAWLAGWLTDQLAVVQARARVHAGPYLFVLEGWIPRGERERLMTEARAALGPDIEVTVLGSEVWRATEAPVALVNPPLFRPFEVITRLFPLPRYGSIDPTPFVAVFFPAFFGVILGDVGYGAVATAAAMVLRRRSRPGSALRSVGTIGVACGVSSMVMGLVYGELFGSLGHALGMRPLFDREEAVVPFLLLAVGLGVVHVTLGLVLGVVSSWRRGHTRHALGKGVTALMVLLTVVALLAAFEALPGAFFTPAVVAVLVAFPVLVAAEGVVAVVELLSTFGHILSYARIMALGTASLMLAVVANELVGAMGSVVVGVLFALLFHLVNFAIGLFSPTIHALRLHTVEFFGTFFSPGGEPYRPLKHVSRSLVKEV